MTSTIGIPIKLLNEAQVRQDTLSAIAGWLIRHQNHVITLEISSGQVYRGKLIEGQWRSSLGCIVSLSASFCFRSNRVK